MGKKEPDDFGDEGFEEPEDDDGSLGDEADVVPPAPRTGKIPDFRPTSGLGMPPLPDSGHVAPPDIDPREYEEPPDHEEARAPRPGMTKDTTSQKMGRAWAQHHPDDRMCKVRLWHVVNGIPTIQGTYEPVLLSVATEPERWIRYRGKWVVDIRDYETGRQIKTLRTRTEGAEPPETGWEPYFETEDDDMGDPRKLGPLFAEMLKAMGINPQQAQQGYNPGAVSTGVFNDQLGYLRYQLDETQKKVERRQERIEALQGELSREQAARAGAEQRAVTLKEQVDRMQREVDVLRLNGGNGHDKDSPWIAMMSSQTQSAERMASADRQHSRDMMTMMLEVFKGRSSGGVDQLSQGWSQLFTGALEMAKQGKQESGGASDALIGVLGQVVGPAVQDKVRQVLGAGPGGVPLAQQKAQQQVVQRPQQSQPQNQLPPAQTTTAAPATEDPQDALRKAKAEIFTTLLSGLLEGVYKGYDPEELGRDLALTIRNIKRQDIPRYVPDAARFCEVLETNPEKELADIAKNLGMTDEAYIAALVASFKYEARLDVPAKKPVQEKKDAAEEPKKTDEVESLGADRKAQDVSTAQVPDPASGTNHRRGNRGRPARKRDESGQDANVPGQTDQDVGDVAAEAQ